MYAGKFVVGIHKIVTTKCLVELEDTADLQLLMGIIITFMHKEFPAYLRPTSGPRSPAQ